MQFFRLPVIPAKAGIFGFHDEAADSCFRRNDKKAACHLKIFFIIISINNVMCNFFLSFLRKQESAAGNVPNQGALDSCFCRNDRQLGKVAHGVK
jgi:hypothetical protein